MLPVDTLATYLLAVLLVVISPGPDNLLALSRGLSQGRVAGMLSSFGAGMGILVHTVAATLGLTLVVQASPVAFWSVKAAGGAYLVWLGVKALRSNNLISFASTARQPLPKVFAMGLLSNVLNPKPGLFVLAFIPQFVNPKLGPVPAQMLMLGAIFALVTALVFSLLVCFSAQLSGWLVRRPRVTTWLNRGAGGAFIVAGLSILALRNRR